MLYPFAKQSIIGSANICRLGIGTYDIDGWGSPYVALITFTNIFMCVLCDWTKKHYNFSWLLLKITLAVFLIFDIFLGKLVSLKCTVIKLERNKIGICLLPFTQTYLHNHSRFIPEGVANIHLKYFFVTSKFFQNEEVLFFCTSSFLPLSCPEHP
jgi:hypothetical protein